MVKEKILLVDDEQTFADVLSERLQARGLEVVTAADGVEAVQRAKQERFDAVVLDMLMPGMSGLETLKNLLRADPTLKIVLLTGHASVARGIEAMKLGAMDFLEKPIDIESLIETIRGKKGSGLRI